MSFPYKIVIFDIDNTLTESRLPMADDLSRVMSKLIDSVPVAIISGGSLKDFEYQVISKLTHKKKENLLVLPTEGAELRIFERGAWHTVYSYTIDNHKRRKIFEELAKEIGVSPVNLGGLVEDRGGVIAYHPLGKDAPLSEKYAWDPTREKRLAIIKRLEPRLHGVFMAAAGSTTINFSEQGMNKAFGVKKLLEYTHILAKDALFIGDALYEGGNDAPVKTLNTATISTKGPQDTLRIVEDLIHGSKKLH